MLQTSGSTARSCFDLAAPDWALRESSMPEQRYVSDELTHFVGASEEDDEARYQLMLKILNEGWLTHPPHLPGFSASISILRQKAVSSNEMIVPAMVCFCDIPPDDLDVHVAKYGRFGIAFPKATLIDRGANPVFYVALTSQVFMPFARTAAKAATPEGSTTPDTKVLSAIFGQPVSLGDVFDTGLEMWHEYSDLTGAEMSIFSPGESEQWDLLFDIRSFLMYRVFSYLKFFDPRLSHSDRDNFYLEREWRVVGNVQFTISEVIRLLVPDSFGARLRQDLPAYSGQVQFLH